MNEYIPREDVSVNVKNGLSKIVDELPEDVTSEDLKRLNYCLHVNQVVQRIIRDIPTAEVREVVECRNCIHWHSDEGSFMLCGYSGLITDDWDFCSYGEKRYEERGRKDDGTY